MTNVCPICGSFEFREDSFSVRVPFEGSMLSVSAITSVCQSCDADIAFPEHLRANKRAVIAAQWAHMQLPTAEKISRWRSRWGLSQQAAGRLLGVGPTAFSKYENSALLPSAPTARLLHLLTTSDAATRDLASHYGVVLHESAAVAAAANGGFVMGPVQTIERIVGAFMGVTSVRSTPALVPSSKPGSRKEVSPAVYLNSKSASR